MRKMRLPETEKMPLHHGDEVVEKAQCQHYGSVDLTSSSTPSQTTPALTAKSSILPTRHWTISIIISITTMAVFYHFLTAFLFASSSLATPVINSNSAVVDDSSNEFWAGLQPSRQLQWHKCYFGRLDCARLDVPLDWQEPSDKERVVLAVVRLSAKNRTDYRGPVFHNPGGPGGSGVYDLSKGNGDMLQRLVGDNHDIVTWDPRGVGASVPRIECWASSAQRHDWASQLSNVDDGNPSMLFEALAKSDAASRHCEAHVNATTPKLLSHISTASHARDMLEISKQMGYEKVKYWGVSYGTILGGTFAALYPDRVERLVSDGNVDYRDWYDNVQLRYLQDADKIMDAFFEFCNKAGPDKCDFFESTPDAIEQRLLKLFVSLRKSPVVVPADLDQTQSQVPRIVTTSDLQAHIRGTTYNAIAGFPKLATILAGLEKRDGGPFYQLSEETSTPSGFNTCNEQDTLPTAPQLVDSSFDAFQAIMCADGALLPADSWTPDAILQYTKELQHISTYLSAASVKWRLACAGRQIRPRWTYIGPYQNITTAFPMLFIGNIADPVTPLESTRNNSRAFPGSVVLIQKTYGHSSFAGTSKCTESVIWEYFQNGKLPATETVCDQDRQPFEDFSQSVVGHARRKMLDHEQEREAFVRTLVKRTNGGML